MPPTSQNIRVAGRMPKPPFRRRHSSVDAHCKHNERFLKTNFSGLKLAETVGICGVGVRRYLPYLHEVPSSTFAPEIREEKSKKNDNEEKKQPGQRLAPRHIQLSAELVFIAGTC